jgi:hypothetical protein
MKRTTILTILAAFLGVLMLTAPLMAMTLEKTGALNGERLELLSKGSGNGNGGGNGGGNGSGEGNGNGGSNGSGNGAKDGTGPKSDTPGECDGEDCDNSDCPIGVKDTNNS